MHSVKPSTHLVCSFVQCSSLGQAHNNKVIIIIVVVTIVIIIIVIIILAIIILILIIIIITTIRYCQACDDNDNPAG